MGLQFTIIVPVYNVERYLERCINSLAAQLSENDLIVIVDDGTKDRSGEIAEVLAQSNKHIRAVHKENGGLSSARNYGLEFAQGDYVLFVDADDYVAHDYLPTIRKELDISFDMLGFGYHMVCNGKTIKEYCSNRYVGEYDREGIVDTLLPSCIANKNLFMDEEIIRSACAYAYRLEFVKKNHLEFRSEREVVNEDFLFNLESLLKADSLKITDKILYRYDIREGSLSRQYHPNLYITKTKLVNCYEATIMAAGLSEYLRIPMYGFWITSIYECIIQEAWRYSPLKAKERFRMVSSYLNDEKLQKALAEYPSITDGKKAKIIRFLMRHHMVWCMIYGYRIMDRLKGLR